MKILFVNYYPYDTGGISIAIHVLASKFVDYGFYSRYIEKYLRLFPRGSVLITLYDDIERNPGGFLKKIYGFLQVGENFIPPSLHKIVNPSAALRLEKMIGMDLSAWKKKMNGEYGHGDSTNA